jgi:hypothetical protein
MPTKLEATANESGYFPRETFDRISALAHGVPWYQSESGDNVNATVIVTFEDSSTASGEILSIDPTHYGSFRDPADVWTLTDGSRPLLVEQRILLREAAGDRIIRVKRATHVAIVVDD